LNVVTVSPILRRERHKPNDTAESGQVNQRGDNMTTAQQETEQLLTPAEVASMFRVDPKTVTRWAKAGKLSSIRTLGGHRRYRESEIRGLLEGSHSRS
jgi:excisionase family DNA binding protein